MTGKQLLATLFLCASLFAGGPGKGRISKAYPAELFENLTVNYNISQLMGEPTCRAEWKWTPSPNANLAAMRKGKVVIWLVVKVEADAYRKPAYLKIHSGPLPDPDQFTFDVTGSPSWSRVLADRVCTGSQEADYLEATQAKDFWKQAFVVTGVKVCTSL